MDDIEALFSMQRRLARAAALHPRRARRRRGRATARRAGPRSRDGRGWSGSTARASAPEPTRSRPPWSTSRSRPRRSSSSRSRRGGVFQRLQSHKFWQSANCILVSLAGVPTRATRRFIRKLSDECRLPVYAFVDCDPYGISNIYRTLKVGSGNAAHLSQFFCVPHRRASWASRRRTSSTTSCPRIRSKRSTSSARSDALKNDPFFRDTQAVAARPSSSS